MGHLIDVLAETGGYTRAEASMRSPPRATLPTCLTYNPSKPAGYPNGRGLRDDVADYARGS